MDAEINATGQGAETKEVRGEKLATVTANSVSLADSQVNQLQAVDVVMSRGGIGRGQAAAIQITEGGIGLAQGQAITVSNGGVGLLLAREATVNDGSVAFMLAGKLSGNPKIGFDLRAGAVMGLVMGIIVVLFQLFRGRGACCE
jgi:hypothetical protein